MKEYINRMDRQIITIGVNKETNEVFEKYLALERLPLIACDGMSEAIKIMSKESFGLIMLNASSCTYDNTQEAVSRLRSMTYAPILVLSTLEAAASALEVGADVCIPPDAELHVLFSQAMALIRRYKAYNHYDIADPEAATIYRGDLMIDSKRHLVTQAKQEIQLTPTEFRLLAYLARNPGIVLAPEQIGHAVWLHDQVQDRDVTRVVSALRNKLGDNRAAHRYIETVHGVGYRFLLGES